MLPQLKRHLEKQYGSSNIDVLKIDIRNEVHFLKQIDKTPSFLVYERKGNNFWDLDMKFSDPLTPEEKRIAINRDTGLTDDGK